MSRRNENFAKAIDWLYANGKVADQKELSEVTGINPATISRILNDKVKEPSEETLRKLNSTFGGVFNMDFFRGRSDEMLAKGETEKELTALAMPEKSDRLLTAKDETISALKSELNRADSQIASMQKQLVDKDDIITLLKDKVANLERLVAKSQSTRRHSFPVDITDDGSIGFKEVK
jgi:transcriptional regulator with XRE-family HTH domain